MFSLVLLMIRPLSELKQITLLAVNPLVLETHTSTNKVLKDPLESHVFAQIDDGMQGQTTYFLLHDSEDLTRLNQKELAYAQTYGIFRIEPFSSITGKDLTTTIVLTYAGQRFLEHGIAMRTLGDRDYDYLMIKERDLPMARRLLEELFTVRDVEMWW